MTNVGIIIYYLQMRKVSAPFLDYGKTHCPSFCLRKKLMPHILFFRPLISLNLERSLRAKRFARCYFKTLPVNQPEKNWPITFNSPHENVSLQNSILFVNKWFISYHSKVSWNMTISWKHLVLSFPPSFIRWRHNYDVKYLDSWR